MIHEDIVTLIETMRAIQWEDDDTIREVLSSVESDRDLLDRAFRACNNPISEDMSEPVEASTSDNVIDVTGYFK